MTSIYRGQKPRSLSSFFSIWPPTQNEDYTSSTTTCLEEDGRRGEEVTSGVPVIYIKELFTHGSKPFVIIICGRGHFVKKHMLVAAGWRQWGRSGLPSPPKALLAKLDRQRRKTAFATTILFLCVERLLASIQKGSSTTASFILRIFKD